MQAQTNFQFIPNDTILGQLTNKRLYEKETQQEEGPSYVKNILNDLKRVEQSGKSSISYNGGKSSSVSENDGKEPSVLLVSGPNMGGKSTLLR